MSTFTKRALIVIPADLAATANAKAAEVDQEGGLRTFTVGLVPAGSPPGTVPTAYWCSWAVTPAMWTALTTRLNALPLAASRVKIYDGNVRSAESVLAELGLERARPAGGLP